MKTSKAIKGIETSDVKPQAIKKASITKKKAVRKYHPLLDGFYTEEEAREILKKKADEE